jgi:cellulose synthase/poly-beta-1,6-N-acetylglucosamine synthase-like glycosyltransferase
MDWPSSWPSSWPAVQLMVGWGVAVPLAGLALVLTTVLALECGAALWPPVQTLTARSPRATSPQSNSDRWQTTRVAVLIPAHDEAAVIGVTLDRVLPQLKASDQCLVIADNCSDQTATIALVAGATVLERQDPVKRGKGFALDYGLQALGKTPADPSQKRFPEVEPPDVVVVIDADCRVETGAIQLLVEQALATDRPVQSQYLMVRPPEAALQESITVFATRVKNQVRLQGLERLGMPVLLTGTGMAFPWHSLQSVDLASSHLVEDMKLGLDLAIAGHPPTFCAAAQVSGALPQRQAAAKSQRTRWEHGRMQLTTTYIPKLLLEALRQGRPGLAVLALDLCVLPLSLLVVMWAGLAIAATAFGVLTGFWVAAVMLAIAGVLLLGAVLGSWLSVGSQDLPLKQLLLIPAYIFWKLPIYLKFFRKPQTGWVRTERDPV